MRRAVRPFRPARSGARFDPLLPFEAWQELGARVATHASASLWWLGDWIVFGRAKYGRRYKHAIAATGLDHQTLRNYAVVSRRFEPPRRRDDLTFHHHAEVCALCDEEQDAWLDRATAGGWSRNELRRRIRAAAGAPSASEIVRVAVDTARAARWRAAAERSRCPFDAWVLGALDAAAGGAAPGTG